MIRRLCKPLLSNSFFLFGARATGKTTLISRLLQDKRTLVFDLLSPQIEEELSTSPQRFRDQILAAHSKIDWVVLDEVQRVPKLLNIVHQLIESHRIKFAITGSSARKLRRGAANLLAGRAFVNYLFPITAIEAGDRESFELDDVLRWGALPKLWELESSEEKNEFLRSYTATFVQQEIKAEQVVRNLDPFRRFLEVAAQSNAKILNYTKIANDVGCDIKTVQNYYQILDDTMMGYFLEAHHSSVRKAIGQKPKFYFFDIGVQRALAKQLEMLPVEGSSLFGEIFESFFVLECIRLNEYLKKDFTFSYLRTKDDVEIDLIITRPGAPRLLIEIKSSRTVNEKHLRRFDALASDFADAEKMCVCREDMPLLIRDIRVLPWRTALREIFGVGS